MECLNDCEYLNFIFSMLVIQEGITTAKLSYIYALRWLNLMVMDRLVLFFFTFIIITQIHRHVTKQQQHLINQGMNLYSILLYLTHYVFALPSHDRRVTVLCISMTFMYHMEMWSVWTPFATCGLYFASKCHTCKVLYSKFSLSIDQNYWRMLASTITKCTISLKTMTMYVFLNKF